MTPGTKWNRRLRAGTAMAAFAIAALRMPAGAQTSSPLASHWGASDYPEFKRGFQSGMTFLSFTEYDSEGRRFGETRTDSSAAPPYPESMGFNFLSLAYGNHVNSRSAELSNMMYRYTASLGLNADQFTEFYQNDVIHKGYRAIPPVPRDRVRCEDPLRLGCAEFAVGGEIFYRFTNIELEDKLKFYSSNFFVGVGTSLGSPLMEGYVELGVSKLPTLVTTEYLGIRVAGMIRVGGILQSPFRDTRFDKLAPGYYLVQGGIESILLEKIYRIILSNNFTYHSGLFVDDQGREIRELFWTVGIDIDSFYFETFNDMLGGTDFGPTFGGRFYWDIEKPGRILGAIETFVQNLNGSR
ncbi:MAG: exported protein of unknown function [Fibrobacteres bacterium]|nr:exported protein of unknown function [Fibrobacterota bacterium]